ncbi:MAG TPA: DUF6624 domain-containing protein, partial [Chitinophagaceae bacterium]|nr:DUF6624 domain-containing protein [Chitinophagaceae bacterium]
MAKPSLIILFLMLGLATWGQNRFQPTENYLKWTSKAFRLYEENKYKESALTYDSAFNSTKGEGTTTDKYNAACSWALAGNADKAFLYLDKAIVDGKWSDLSHILTDGDLVSIHGNKRWEPLIEIVRKNKEIKDATLNKPLAAILDTVYKDDQDHRLEIGSVQKQFGWQSAEMRNLWEIINRKDSINLIKVRNIIDTYGWLGPDELGNNGATTIFLVIQHADSLTQVTYLPLMREAVKKGKAMPQNLALLEDRVLMKQGKEQIYGSQV